MGNSGQIFPVKENLACQLLLDREKLSSQKFARVDGQQAKCDKDIIDIQCPVCCKMTNKMAATSTKLSWSDKAVSLLLDLLHSRESLWNTKHESYKDRNIKKS